MSYCEILKRLHESLAEKRPFKKKVNLMHDTACYSYNKNNSKMQVGNSTSCTILAGFSSNIFSSIYAKLFK